MIYSLMHKNLAVAEIKIDTSNGSLISAGKLFDPAHLPVGVGFRDNTVDHNSIKSWWSSRSIPISRSGLKKSLQLIGVDAPSELLAKCMGLSLSDQYWVKPENSDLQWENINFFDNTFSDDIGNILFGYKTDNNKIDTISPDAASDGWLKKRWKIINGERCLIKSGSNFFQEPFNEVIAYNIAKLLGISHVPYSLSYEGKNYAPISICPDFITNTTELISAAAISKVLPRNESESKISHFEKCCEYLKIPDFRKSIDNMLILDYIIANQDRHMGNFGAVRNAETLEYIGIAPIYDSGTSLRYDTPTVYIDPYSDIEAQPFASFHNEQIKLVGDFSSFGVSKLEEFNSIFKSIFSDSKAEAYIDKKRQEKILDVIRQRIDMLNGYIGG